MQIKSIVAAAGVVLLATAGAAQAGEVLTATDRAPASESFAMLDGLQAEPMDAIAMDRVRGQATFSLFLLRERGIAINMVVDYADVVSEGKGVAVTGDGPGVLDSCWIFVVNRQ